MYVDILSSSSFIFYLLYCYATIYNNYTQFPHPWCTQSVEGIKNVSCLSTCVDNTWCWASEAEKDGLSFFPSCFLSHYYPSTPAATVQRPGPMVWNLRARACGECVIVCVCACECVCVCARVCARVCRPCVWPAGWPCRSPPHEGDV